MAASFSSDAVSLRPKIFKVMSALTALRADEKGPTNKVPLGNMWAFCTHLNSVITLGFNGNTITYAMPGLTPPKNDIFGPKLDLKLTWKNSKKKLRAEPKLDLI